MSEEKLGELDPIDGIQIQPARELPEVGAIVDLTSKSSKTSKKNNACILK